MEWRRPPDGHLTLSYYTYTYPTELCARAHTSASGAVRGNFGGFPPLPVNNEIMVEAALGQRVVRGPDWEWGDQDGGEGFVGTVAGLEEGGGGVIVQWDMGQRCRYRCGRDNKFELRVLDDGPSGSQCSITDVVTRCM